MRVLSLLLASSLWAPAFAADEHVTVRSTSQETIFRLDIDYPNTEMREIARGIAAAADLNLVFPSGVSGRVSMHLRDVTWQQAFDVLLTPVGMTYRVRNGVVEILSPADLESTSAARSSPSAPDSDQGSFSSVAVVLSGVAAVFSTSAFVLLLASMLRKKQGEPGSPSNAG